MADLENPRYTYDIQKKEYTEGSDLLEQNPELSAETYTFKFDRLYTIHDQDLKTYNFIVKLTEDTKKDEENKFGNIVIESDSQKAPFVWQVLEDEIWHIDTTIDQYNLIVNSLWKNYTDENGEILSQEKLEEMNRNAGVQHYDEMMIKLKGQNYQIPENWEGKDKIYFITDAYPEINLKFGGNYEMLPEDEGYSEIINTSIETIRDAIKALRELKKNADELFIAAGINPSDYGL